jgi:2,3-dihydroxyphenylpropionate 1,2-dioxygenase
MMAKVVAALSISHAPGALGWPDAPTPEVRKRMDEAARILGRTLDDARPDVIIAFLDDHFENHFRKLMPMVSIGVANSNTGPADQWLEALKIEKKTTFDGAPKIAEMLLRGMAAQDFDVTRMGEIEYGNNLMVPWVMMNPTIQPAIIPIYFNVFSPPLMSTARAYAFGEALRTVVDGLPMDTRVAFLATGGLSHWPPFWIDSSPEDDVFLQRMKEFQTEGMTVLERDPHLYADLGRYEIEMAETNRYPKNASHPLVNADWDREFLAAIAQGNVDYMRRLTHDEIERRGGHGGFEVLNWIALMGAMHGQPGKIVDYEPVVEWICGMGFVAYDV